MLHARGQSTAVLQQQHADRLHRHTIQTTFAGMAHANGLTVRATVTSSSCWWWRQEQRVVLNFGDADTTQKKATGATSAQIDFVCVICTSNSSTVLLLLLFISLCISLSLFKGTSHNNIAISLPTLLFFCSYNEVFVQTAFIPYFPSGTYYFSICDHGADSLHALATN